MSLVTVDELKLWSGVNIPDQILQACLDESEAQILAELAIKIEDVTPVVDARSIFYGEEMRRAQRLLARRNSPEGVSGFPELGLIQVPTRDPDSAIAIWRLKAILEIPEAVA